MDRAHNTAEDSSTEPGLRATGPASDRAAAGATDPNMAPLAPAPEDATLHVEYEPVPSPGKLPALAYKLGLLVTALVWGSSFFVMKDAVDVLPSNLVLAIRFTVASLVFLVLLWRPFSKHCNRDTAIQGLIMGLLLYLGYALQTVGLTMTTPGKNAFLSGVYCVIVPFGYWLIGGKKPGAHHVLAALMSVLGIGLVSLGGDSLTINLGDGLTLVSAFFFAMHIVMTAVYGRRSNIMALTVWMFIAAAVIAWLAHAIFETPPAQEVFTPSLIGALFYLSVLCTCVTLLIQNVGVRNVNPASASLLLSMESPSGVFFSVVFAGEVLTGRVLAGFVVIFLAVITSETRWVFIRKLFARRHKS